jgi:hypothetical protein
MAGAKDPSGDKISPEASEENRRRRLLNFLSWAGVIALGAILPPKYKGLAPLLLLIPVILNVVYKIRQSGEVPGIPPGNRTYSPSTPQQTSSHEPYTYKPKDPKDPRNYKPIG